MTHRYIIGYNFTKPDQEIDTHKTPENDQKTDLRKLPDQDPRPSRLASAAQKVATADLKAILNGATVDKFILETALDREKLMRHFRTELGEDADEWVVIEPDRAAILPRIES